MGDVFRKVQPGQSLRIPAAAYNAFVDAAVDLRHRERNNAAGPLVETAQRGIVLVRNDSDEDIEPYHALAITGVLVQPGMALLKIAPIDRVRLQANVGEKDVASIRVGSTVTVTGEVPGQPALAARVTADFPLVDQVPRTAVVGARQPGIVRQRGRPRSSPRPEAGNSPSPRS